MTVVHETVRGAAAPDQPRRPEPVSRRPLYGVRHYGALALAIRDALAPLQGPTPFSLATAPSIEHRLGQAVAEHLSCSQPCGRVAVCVRVACAQLASGDIEQARLALLETHVNVA